MSGDELPYSKTFVVLWSDLDANGHMRGARYLDYASEVPFHFLKENGFDIATFAREQVGPVTFTQAIRHFKEARFGDVFSIDHRLKGLSADGARWAFRHHIVGSNGDRLAIAESAGGFFSRSARTIAAPPPGVVALIRRLPKEDDYSVLAPD